MDTEVRGAASTTRSPVTWAPTCRWAYFFGRRRLERARRLHVAGRRRAHQDLSVGFPCGVRGVRRASVRAAGGRPLRHRPPGDGGRARHRRGDAGPRPDLRRADGRLGRRPQPARLPAGAAAPDRRALGPGGRRAGRRLPALPRRHARRVVPEDPRLLAERRGAPAGRSIPESRGGARGIDQAKRFVRSSELPFVERFFAFSSPLERTRREALYQPELRARVALDSAWNACRRSARNSPTPICSTSCSASTSRPTWSTIC